MSAPAVNPELRALLRRVKFGRCLDTLPERLALAQLWPNPSELHRRFEVPREVAKVGLHLIIEQLRRVRQLRNDGLTVPDVAREIGCSLRTVKRVTAGQGQARGSPDPLVPG